MNIGQVTKMICLYILLCNNQTYYIGSTNNLKRRLKEHKNGKSIYTKSILPVKLVFTQQYSDLTTARKYEYWIKKQKSRILIEKIIEQGKIIKKFQ